MTPELLKTLCDHSTVATIVTGNDGVVIFHNRAATDLLGDPLTGKTISVFISENTFPEEMMSSTAIRLALDKDGEIKQVRGKDGNTITASVTKTSAGKNRAAYYIRDITEQIRYILKVKQQQKTENELARSSYIRNGKLDEALREIAMLSAGTMEVKRVNIWLIDEGFNSIHSLVNYDQRKGGFLDNIILYKQDFPNYFGLMQTEEIIPTTDALNDPKIREIRDSYIIPFGIQSLLDVPVRIEGKMAGVICFEDTDRQREWNVSEQNFSAAIAQIIAQTIETHRRQVAQSDLEQALAEKKLLLAEVNHRIKNNFSIVADLIRLQEEKTTDENQRRLFSEVRSRLLSMAMIHRQLYSSENIGAVNFRDFLLDLAAHFRSTFATDGISISTLLDNCRLPISKAILCGLIVNELLTNSCRHAFGDTEKGLVQLKLSTTGGKIQVSVSDNGSYDNDGASGVGAELVDELIGRLHATLEKKHENGTEIVITFSPAKV